MRGFGTCCLRFKSDVAAAPARLASGWPARPLPGGSRTLWTAMKGSAHMSSPFPGLTLTLHPPVPDPRLAHGLSPYPPLRSAGERREGRQPRARPQAARRRFTSARAHPRPIRPRPPRRAPAAARPCASSRRSRLVSSRATGRPQTHRHQDRHVMSPRSFTRRRSADRSRGPGPAALALVRASIRPSPPSSNRRQAPVAERPEPHRQHGAISRSMRQTSQQRPRQAAPRRNPHSARQRRNPPPAGSFSEGFPTTAPAPPRTSSIGRRPKSSTGAAVRGSGSAARTRSTIRSFCVKKFWTVAVNRVLDVGVF